MNFVLDIKLAVQYYTWILWISLDEVKQADSEKRGLSKRKAESCFFFHELDSNLLNFFY